MFRTAAACITAVALFAGVAGGQMIYWTDGLDNAILRAKLDGSDIVTLIASGLDQPDGIAIDPVGQKMYWAERGGFIRRADLDGANVETLVETAEVPRDVALDTSAGKLYWVGETTPGVWRANLDGTEPEFIEVLEVGGASTVAIEPVKGKILWGGGGAVHRMNLDGSSPEFFLITDNGSIRQIAIDTDNELIYWVNEQFRFIGWVGYGGNPNGEGEILQTGDAQPHDVALEPVSQWFFWTEWGESGVGSIRRADFGGANVTTIIPSGLTDPAGIAIGPSPDEPVAVPTASQWGLAVMVCMLLVAGTLVLRHRDVRSRQAARR